jgi:YceG-like Ter operon protein
VKKAPKAQQAQQAPPEQKPAPRRRARKASPPPEPAAAAAPAAAPRRSARERAAAGRDALMSRMGRDGADPRPPRPRGAYRRRRILALGLVLVGVLVAWFLIAFFQPPPFDPGNGSGEAIVTVPEGATASEVSDLLTKNDVVSNGTLFEWRLKLAGETGSILPGRYVLAHNMSYGAAIDKLTSSGGKVNVTIPE